MNRQEAVNKKLRDWQVLERVFHHDLSKRSFAFGDVVVLTQLKIQNGKLLYSSSDYVNNHE